MTGIAARRAIWVLVFVLGGTLLLHRSTTALATDALDAPGVGAEPGGTSAALFHGPPMASGEQQVRCTTVSFADAPRDADVRMFVDVTGAALAPWLEATIEVGTGGDDGPCDSFVPSEAIFHGTLADLAARDSYDSGLGASSPSPAGSQTYRITITLRPGAPAGATAGADLHWEARAP